MNAAEPIVDVSVKNPAPVLLEVRDVRKRFGGINALAGCSFYVAEREIVGVIGPNGSGKTTLFNIIAGYLPQDAGSVRFRGQDLQDLRPFQIARRGIARTFQVTRIFPKMTCSKILSCRLDPVTGARKHENC